MDSQLEAIMKKRRKAVGSPSGKQLSEGGNGGSGHSGSGGGGDDAQQSENRRSGSRRSQSQRSNSSLPEDDDHHHQQSHSQSHSHSRSSKKASSRTGERRGSTGKNSSAEYHANDKTPSSSSSRKSLANTIERRGSTGRSHNDDEPSSSRTKARRRLTGDTSSSMTSKHSTGSEGSGGKKSGTSSSSSSSRKKSSSSGSGSGSGSGTRRSTRSKTSSSRMKSQQPSSVVEEENDDHHSSSDDEDHDEGKNQDDEYSSDEQEEPPKQPETPASTGWSTDWGSTPAFDNANTTTTTSTTTSNTSGGFASFDSFPADFGSPPAATTTTTSTTFDSSAFDTTFDTTAVFANAGPFDPTPSDDAYEPPSFEPLKPAKIWDKAPWEDPPLVTTTDAHTTQTLNVRTILRRDKPVTTNDAPVFLPDPVVNPLSGNIIVCRKDKRTGGMYLHEIDPSRNCVQVLSAPVVTTEFQRKVATKYGLTASAVDTVMTVAVGIHSSHGQARARVAALLDLLVLENNEVLRVVAIWQWGYGTTSHHPITLQSILSPPSGSDFSYQTESLLVTDSCVFVAGASAKGPCVFLCKPTVKETWSANFVGKESVRIASMKATTTKHRKFPYLAVSLTDGTLSVWTYEAAIAITSKTTETFRRLLHPLCRLEGTKALLRPTTVSWVFDNEDSGSNDTHKDVGFCTHLEWLPPRSGYSNLLLLAATFQGGIALFHIAMPVIAVMKKQRNSIEQIKAPTPTTQLNQTVSLSPFAIARWPSLYNSTAVAWADLGPHVSPCVTVMLKGMGSKLDITRIVVASVQFPMYGTTKLTSAANKDIMTSLLGSNSPSVVSDQASLVVWAMKDFEPSSTNKWLPHALLGCNITKSLGRYLCDQGIVELLPSATALDAVKASRESLSWEWGHLISSTPSGLTSGGDIFVSNDKQDKDGILHVFTVYQCERQKTGTNSEGEELLDWSPPTRRHWLCRTLVGDCKDALPPDDHPIYAQRDEEAKTAAASGNGDDTVQGGAISDVVCELGGSAAFGSSVPLRMIRGLGLIVGVVFGENAIAPTRRNMLEGHTICLVDETSSSLVVSLPSAKVAQLIEGRDIIFLPKGETSDNPKALVLSRDGGTLSLYEKKPSDETAEVNTEQQPWTLGTAYRPILGVEEDQYVECRRLMLGKFLLEIFLLAVGTQAVTDDDGKPTGQYKSCIISGPLVDYDGDSTTWSNLLPNFETDPVFWFNEGEEISLIVPLPSEGQTRGGVAIATMDRIMILSPDMKLLAQVSVISPPQALAPMGSYTVAYCANDHKIRYLAGLEGVYGTGVIATLPSLPRYGYCHQLLMAVRPDRLVHSPFHSGTRLVEKGESSFTFLLPTPVIRPALLLEPMIANAISTGGKDIGSMPLLRTVIEKFGRKVSSITHSEDEGIGNLGAGITPRVFELLERFNLKAAASWLLTGTVHFDRAANSRLVPNYLPISAKVKAALNADTNLHLIANGDQYFSEYVKSPDTNMSATLPRPSDPSAFICKEFANEALRSGRTMDALKLLDIVGTESSDTMLLQIVLSMQSDPFMDVTMVLKALSQQDGQIGKTTSSSAAASLAALALELREKKQPAGQPMSAEFTNRWMKVLAPSLQQGKKMGRSRQRIIGEGAFAKIDKNQTKSTKDRLFASETNESKHVWNEGPKREKENLLMLDSIQEWFGRQKPVILGKEGAKSAEDRGASTLADILNKQDEEDSFGGGDEDEGFKDGWVDGVGEGLKDEDKLSAYFRLSEGDDEDSAWREEGFTDLTKYENKAVVVGIVDSVTLQESSSSVDEGESGKVKALFDLVFDESGEGISRGLAITANRGGSLDVGMMHGPDHDSRQKCTIEFWFWVPEKITCNVVLVRRTYGVSGGDMDKVCTASDKSASLWELVLDTAGELELRSANGSKAKTEPTPQKDGDESEGPKSSVAFERWNHVCLTFKQESTLATACVTLYLKGEEEFSESLSFSPPGVEVDDFAGASSFDEILDNSHLVFALDHPASFRLTELRVWALERMEDDIRRMMNEYLDCAEMKRKFRVKIKKKGGGGGLKLPAPGGLAPPGSSKGVLAPPGGFKPPPADSTRVKKSLLAPPKDARGDDKKKLAPPKSDFTSPLKDDKPVNDSAFDSDVFGSFGATKDDTTPISFGTGFGDTPAFGSAEPTPAPVDEKPEEPTPVAAAAAANSPKQTKQTKTPLEEPAVSADASDTPPSAAVAGTEDDEEDEIPEISPLWDSAIPLSEQVRSSAAAALIRGPPATRHFGGNRGGLPDYRELERFGVGAISICGSEKTIVWRDDQVPPGLTYPIGASGAIVSDQMDEDGSEFLCCFLAKDKRMVVFELSTRTVVVELQMTTKLNFWRFLPPEAGEDTLCFMLVTPVGGFHWMPLDESPRPRQVWKRGPELQGKKIVCYEEGGTNGLDGPDMLSKVGLLLVTNTSSGGRLESWLVPVCGDSQALCASDDVLGACLCRPPDVGYEAWMPLLLFVVESEGHLIVCVSAVTEVAENSIGLTHVMTDALIDQEPYKALEFAPPTLAMGTWPEVLCCSLGSTIVIIVRRKGLVVAYELAETGLELIAQENVGHYVVDAVMRYSAVEGGAEIVLLMSDEDNPRDGRVGTFCFRSAI